MINIGAEHPPATEFARQIIAIATEAGTRNAWDVTHHASLERAQQVGQQLRIYTRAVNFQGLRSPWAADLFSERYVSARLLARTSFTGGIEVDRELTWQAIAPTNVAEETTIHVSRWKRMKSADQPYPEEVLRQRGRDHRTVSWTSGQANLDEPEIEQLIAVLPRVAKNELDELGVFGIVSPEQLQAGTEGIIQKIHQTSPTSKEALEDYRQYAEAATVALRALPTLLDTRPQM